MAYEFEEVKTSQEIFCHLLEHHELREDEVPRLYRAYTESEPVQNLVKSQGESADCSIERYGDGYILYSMGNWSFGGTGPPARVL